MGIWLLAITLLFLMTAPGMNGQIDEEFLTVSTASDTLREDNLARRRNINFGSNSMVLVPVKSTPKKNKSISGNDKCSCLGYRCAKVAHTSSFVKNHKIDWCIDYLNKCCSSQSPSEKYKKPYLKRVIQAIQKPVEKMSNPSSESYKRLKRTSSSIETYKCTDYNSGKEHIHGQEYGGFPWMVSIYDFDPVSQSPIDYLCSGSLINPQVVLTTAHCPQKSNLKTGMLLVRAGELDFKPLQMNVKMLKYQDRRVSKIILHEYYNQEYGQNDIALILLTKPFDLQRNIGTICLPPQGYHVNNTRCKTTDWVANDVDKISPDDNEPLIRKVDLRLVPRKECVGKLRSTELGSEFQLHESLLCGGGEIGNGMCTFKPNGGTPLTCSVPGNPQRFFQLGIYSWRIGCNNSSPNVYVAVSQYRDWLDAKMADFDRSYYDADNEF